jgi:tetratricopeptide (TPR) repeat protein
MPRLFEQLHDAYASGEISRAFSLVKYELRSSPSDGRAWEWLGVVQYSRGRHAVAVSALERASLLVPLQTASRICLALGYGKVGRRELSRQLLFDFVGDESVPIRLLLQVASGLDAIDRPDQAMEACRAACRCDPDFAQTYYDLAYYAARCGNSPRIIESLIRRAIAFDVDNVCYRVGLATLFVRQDRIASAHQVIASFSSAEISRIGCRRCLERMAEIFWWFNDEERAAICHCHSRRLASEQSSQDCH